MSKKTQANHAMKALAKVRRMMASIQPTYNIRPRRLRHLIAQMFGHNLDNMTSWRG